MAWRTSLGRNWSRLRDGLKRELLRDPHRILLDRAAEPPLAQPGRAAAADNR